MLNKCLFWWLNFLWNSPTFLFHHLSRTPKLVYFGEHLTSLYNYIVPVLICASGIFGYYSKVSFKVRCWGIQVLWCFSKPLIVQIALRCCESPIGGNIISDAAVELDPPKHHSANLESLFTWKVLQSCYWIPLVLVLTWKWSTYLLPFCNR